MSDLRSRIRRRLGGLDLGLGRFCDLEAGKPREPSGHHRAGRRLGRIRSVSLFCGGREEPPHPATESHD